MMVEMRVMDTFDHHNEARKEEIIITQDTMYKVAPWNSLMWFPQMDFIL